MVLVDTSVWVEHLRKGSHALGQLLQDLQVVCHPFVVGELACGNLNNRDKVLSLLSKLPQAESAQHHEVLKLIEARNLAGAGIGWIDAHLIASAMLSGTLIWTIDQRLKKVVAKLGLAFA